MLRTYGLGTTGLIMLNDEMEDIMKIVKSLEDCGLLIKVVIKLIEKETKQQIGGFLGMILGTLFASLLQYMLGKGKGVVVAWIGKRVF